MDKFKGMTKRELAGYIWDYYKIHIIGAVIVVILAASLINTIFINPADKTYAGVVIYGEQVEYSALAALEKLLTDTVVPGDMKPGYTAMTDNFYGGSQAQADMAMSMKLVALMSVGEVDVIIASRDNFGELVSGVGLTPLDGVLTEGRMAELADRLVEGVGAEDEAPLVYGVEITGSEALAACGILLDRPVAGFAPNLKTPEVSVEAFEVLAR